MSEARKRIQTFIDDYEKGENKMRLTAFQYNGILMHFDVIENITQDYSHQQNKSIIEEVIEYGKQHEELVIEIGKLTNLLSKAYEDTVGINELTLSDLAEIELILKTS